MHSTPGSVDPMCSCSWTINTGLNQERCDLIGWWHDKEWILLVSYAPWYVDPMYSHLWTINNSHNQTINPPPLFFFLNYNDEYRAPEPLSPSLPFSDASQHYLCAARLLAPVPTYYFSSCQPSLSPRDPFVSNPSVAGPFFLAKPVDLMLSTLPLNQRRCLSLVPSGLHNLREYFHLMDSLY